MKIGISFSPFSIVKKVFVPIFFVIIACGCSRLGKEEEAEKGKRLAQQYCAACHLMPEPSLLTKATWKDYVLPRMGYMLGVYENDSVRATLIEDGPGGKRVTSKNIFPEEQLIENEKWDAIQRYFVENAPDSFPPAKHKISLPVTKLFRPVPTTMSLTPPSTTLVKWQKDKLFIGDANSKTFYQLDSQLKLEKAAKIDEAAVNMQSTPAGYLLTVMGSFSPTDSPTGFVFLLPTEPDIKAAKIVDNLQRPVHTSVGDLNGDGALDLVICEFGKWTGKLAWWEQRASGLKHHIIKEVAGAIRTQLKDFNGDGYLDVIALFGQGDEGISIFYNDGKGTFKEDRILRFPASYGSSFFDLFDFNKDGFPDIVYTAGDNADYPPLYKPYHGIRIFENDGDNQFSEKYFYQFNGAYAAIPADLDLDGDVDLAAISFFPNFQNGESSFILLDNQNEEFLPYTIEDPYAGRWIVMDSGDKDGDGDEDIVLGALTFEVVPAMGLVNRWVKDGLPFQVLENTTR
ncbi:MAG: VCBS repeat-containing protein [Cyclobacteriaceae bacterium]|nr:VCBS repeat-containing protein [Cyclobacteriaceae bacterium HetDA_MAG_MS6]